MRLRSIPNMAQPGSTPSQLVLGLGLGQRQAEVQARSGCWVQVKSSWVQHDEPGREAPLPLQNVQNIPKHGAFSLLEPVDAALKKHWFSDPFFPYGSALHMEIKFWFSLKKNNVCYHLDGFHSKKNCMLSFGMDCNLV